MGKPTSGNALVPIAEYIGYKEVTRRTETSKYPEEEKTKVISQVAASERELGQTTDFGLWGCGQSERDVGILVEGSGKAHRRW